MVCMTIKVGITMKRKYWEMILVAIVCLYAGVVFLWIELPDGKMHIRFLDVGQGDSVLIQSPEGHNVLIDGGSKRAVLSQLNEVLPYFNNQIDFMILTHPHSDHLEGLVEVLNKYKVKNVLITGVAYNNSYYKEFLQEINKLKEDGELNVYIAIASSDFRVGSLYFDTIYPLSNLSGRVVSNLNNSSIGFIVYYKDESGRMRKFLLNGDNEAEVEKEILDSFRGVENKISSKDAGSPFDIVKASHHGSRTANSFDFVSFFKPKTVVIQCGLDNSFGHPHAETLRTYERVGVENVYRNDLDGRVEFEF